eukprot:CCRYP_010038-RB/>CCRYP_010038-RB protein AED:0.02 eAED:0.02 QI:286/1/1/1/0.5/0.42/7/2478/1240
MEGATLELQQLLTTPPPSYAGGTLPPNPHAILHASLEYLRDTGDERYLFLRCTLEMLHGHGFVGSTDGTVTTTTTSLSPDEETLLFHCVTGVRQVMLLRWDEYGTLRDVVRDVMLLLGLGGGGVLPRTVAMACLSCAASFWKRGWGGDALAAVAGEEQQAYLARLICELVPNLKRFSAGEEGRCELFQYLNAVMIAPFGDMSKTQMHASAMSASFLSLLVGEFSGGNSSSRYNLPLEFHRTCHQVFENGVAGNKSGLDSTLESSMTSLSALVGYILTTAGNNVTTPMPALSDGSFLEMGSAIIAVTFDVISWEFGAGRSKWEFGSSTKEAAVLLRPPKRWRQVLINPDFLGAMFQVYSVIRVDSEKERISNRLLAETRGRMAHQLRQLLLQLSSIALGPIFEDEHEHGAYASFLLDGCLNVLEAIVTKQHQQPPTEPLMEELISSEIVDLSSILSRITTNFKVQTLSRLPTFQRFLSFLCTFGRWLLESSLAECTNAKGDIESMEGIDWKNDAIAQILQCSDAMADDYWLVSSGTRRAESMTVLQALATLLAPLYASYCMCKVQMSSLEEHYLADEGADLDDVREEISASGLEDEMSSAASLGRLNVFASLTTLSEMFQQCMPKLLALFTGPRLENEMTPDIAALMEEARMLIVCACHLLTDECPGESPTVPDAISKACITSEGSDNEQCIMAISSLVDLLMKVAEAQATRVSMHPEESACSPLLSKTLLWFFRRWAAAYVFPTPGDYRQSGGIYGKWATQEQAQPVISFCTTLCLLYFCHWPLEKEVQDECNSLLLAIAKRGHSVRHLLVNAPSFEQIAALHVVCASLRPNSSPNLSDLETFGGSLTPALVRGYQRLPFLDRSKVLTSLLVGCSEMKNEKASSIMNECLVAVEKSFKLLVQALESKQVHSSNINAQESACLAISLYNGIALASEMCEPERIPHFITPSLPHLSGLIKFDSFADDLSICGALLTFFRDYAEQCIGMLNHEQCSVLFTSVASLLKSYSEHHCKNRVIRRKAEDVVFEEEQKYNDVLCAIQLLIHLGTKDFVDVFNAESPSSQGMGSESISDVIFFGLQQILPLVSQGLLQFPTLCTHYFSLVGSTIENYPEKICVLPFDLFKSLLDSLIFGMSNSDPLVCREAARAIGNLAGNTDYCNEILRHGAILPQLVACFRGRNVECQRMAAFALSKVSSNLTSHDELHKHDVLNLVKNECRVSSDPKPFSDQQTVRFCHMIVSNLT